MRIGIFNSLTLWGHVTDKCELVKLGLGLITANERLR